MSDIINGKPTMTFWFIGGVALIWNIFGMMVYVMTVSASPEEMAMQYTPEQVAFIQSTPKWATSAFAIAVTSGVLGSLLLLLRRSLAKPLFIVSLVAVLVQNLNSFVLNDSVAVFGTTPVYIQCTIVAIAIFLIAYARWAQGKGWLG